MARGSGSSGRSSRVAGCEVLQRRQIIEGLVSSACLWGSASVQRRPVSHEPVKEQKQHEEHGGNWEPNRRVMAFSIRVAAVAITNGHGGMAAATVSN